jgi:hypothetical protein
MATTYEFDLRGLPARLKEFDPATNKYPNQETYRTKVSGLLSSNFRVGTVDEEPVLHASVIGLLLLNEQFDERVPGFTSEIRRALDELVGDTLGKANVDYFTKAEVELLKLRTPSTTIFYQELAFVGRFLIKGANEIPLDHPYISVQVKRGQEAYVGGPPVFDSLELPPLTGDDGSDIEIEPENIKAVGMVYAASQLEEMRLFNVVDRITEIFHNGQLPIGFDAGGRAIDDYLWNTEDRMNEAARRMVYSRVLGVKGGDVSKEVQPNSQFDMLFLRFLASLAEYDRQQRISDIVQGSNRPLNLTSEYVRKAGRDLASNLSLYGWGGTHFAARRMRQHIDDAIGILKQPSVQKAYGVTNIYQVIERVAASEFNTTPNIVKSRTMAEAGKAIIDLVAKHSDKWGKTGTSPLFSEPTTIVFNRLPVPPDIPDEDRDVLLRQTQYWLAVNGIKDDQVDKYSEPEIAAYAPSVPSFGGFGAGAIHSNGGSSDGMEKIKQMVTQGQVPSLDQLQQLFVAPKMN